MYTTATVEVVAIGSIEFPVKLKETANLTISAWKKDIKDRHPAVKDLVVQDWFGDPGGYNVYTVRVVMDEDADYQQLCALRAELKS